MGPVQSVISVCGFDAVQQVLNNEDLDNRPHCNMTLTDEAGNKQGKWYNVSVYSPYLHRFQYNEI